MPRRLVSQDPADVMSETGHRCHVSVQGTTAPGVLTPRTRGMSMVAPAAGAGLCGLAARSLPVAR